MGLLMKTFLEVGYMVKTVYIGMNTVILSKVKDLDYFIYLLLVYLVKMEQSGQRLRPTGGLGNMLTNMDL